MKSEELECASCGMVFCVSSQWVANKRKNGDSFYCPNGHSMSFKETTLDIVRRERDRLKQQIAHKDDRIADEVRGRESANRTARAYKGQVTKLRKRAIGGVCPCCNRHFTALERHMNSKHPNFEPEQPKLTVIK